MFSEKNKGDGSGRSTTVSKGYRSTGRVGMARALEICGGVGQISPSIYGFTHEHVSVH
jgi:hypothetical protein